MNIHLPAILMFTRGTRFWHTAIWWIMMSRSHLMQDAGLMRLPLLWKELALSCVFIVKMQGHKDWDRIMNRPCFTLLDKFPSLRLVFLGTSYFFRRKIVGEVCNFEDLNCISGWLEASFGCWGWAIDIQGQFSDLNVFARASQAGSISWGPPRAWLDLSHQLGWLAQGMDQLLNAYICCWHLRLWTGSEMAGKDVQPPSMCRWIHPQGIHAYFSSGVGTVNGCMCILPSPRDVWDQIMSLVFSLLLRQSSSSKETTQPGLNCNV